MTLSPGFLAFKVTWFHHFLVHVTLGKLGLRVLIYKIRTPLFPTSLGQVRPTQDAEGRGPRMVTSRARTPACGGSASYALCGASVISPFAAIRTCVPPQPRPESGYAGSHPTLDHRALRPAQQPDITATGAFIKSCGSRRGGSQSTKSRLHLGVPGTECSGQTRGRVGPTWARSRQILSCQFFLGRSRVNGAQGPAYTGQGFVPRSPTSA